MEFNSLVFPSPKKRYDINFPYLYRIPRDFNNEKVLQGNIQKKESPLYFLRTHDQEFKTPSFFFTETQKMPRPQLKCFTSSTTN